MSELNKPYENPEPDPQTGRTRPPTHEESLKGKNQVGGAASADDPQFAGKPLSFYDRFATADDLKGLDGIGEAKSHEIIAARKKRDRGK